MLLTTTEISVARAIEEFLIDRRLRSLSPESIAWYRKCLRRGLSGFSERKLSEVTLLEVREVIAALLDRGLCGSTINATLQCLKALLNWAIDEDIVVGAEPRRLKSLKQVRMMPQLLTDEQIVALIAAPGIRTFPGRRDRMIMLTFLDTGRRVS